MAADTLSESLSVEIAVRIRVARQVLAEAVNHCERRPEFGETVEDLRLVIEALSEVQTDLKITRKAA